jgi:hypothetical protein
MTAAYHNPYYFNEKAYSICENAGVFGAKSNNFGVNLFEFRKNSPECGMGKPPPRTGWSEEISTIIG